MMSFQKAKELAEEQSDEKWQEIADSNFSTTTRIINNTKIVENNNNNGNTATITVGGDVINSTITTTQTQGIPAEVILAILEGETADDKLQKALSSIEKGSLSEALNYAQELESRSPQKASQIYFVVSQEEVETQQNEQALSHLKKAWELDQSNLEVLYQLGKLQQSTGRIFPSNDSFKKLLELAQEKDDKAYQGRALGHLGQLYATTGSKEGAINYLVQAIDLLSDINSSEAALFEKELELLTQER